MNNPIAQALIDDIDAKLMFHTEQMKKLEDFKLRTIAFYSDSIKPGDTLAPHEKVLPAPNAGKAAGEVGHSPARPGAGRPKGRRNSMERIGSVQQEVNMAVASLPADFKTEDVIRLCPGHGSSSIVSNLSRLVKAGSLSKVSRGQYQKAGSSTNPPENIGNIENQDHSPDAGKMVRKGRLGQTDRARAKILQIAGQFTAAIVLDTLKKNGINMSAAGGLLARMTQAGQLTQMARGVFMVPGKSALPAKSLAAKRGAVIEMKGATSVPNPSDYAAPGSARDNELPPAPGSVSDILARHNVLLDDMQAFHPGAVEIGLTFRGDFTFTDASARIGRKAGEWLARWKASGWIETVGLSTYRRTEKFGKKP